MNQNLKVALVGHCFAGADVSVLSANIQLSPIFKAEPTIGNILYGQDVYFLGFPYSLAIEDFSKINRGFPLPFIKKAVVSNMIKNESFGRLFIIYLDGYNNKGFSGGPMIFRENPQTEYKIGAVISGYEAETEDILFENKKTDLKYQSNTGIIIAYNIDCAIDVILILFKFLSFNEMKIISDQCRKLRFVFSHTSQKQHQLFLKSI